MSQHPSGIIWVGPVYHRGGYGSVSRNFLTGLDRHKVPVQVVPFDSRHYDAIEPDVVAMLKRLEAGNAGQHPALVIHSTPSLFRNVRAEGVIKTIGCTIFETHSIPASWVPSCNSVDELWVPSQFNRSSFARAGVVPERIQVMPYSVEANHSTVPAAPRQSDRPFVYLYVFEFGWRKGFDLLVKAFLHEFRLGEARLVLKVLPRAGQSAEAAEREILRVIASVHASVHVDADAKPPEVLVIATGATSAELERFYLDCDLYISTDRANGWGMPCMEAMALGKPAATINWSGSTEFMHADNSVLIQPTGRLVPVDPRLAWDFPELYGTQCWAEVSESEVRRAMRWAFDHPEELAEIARRGQQTVRELYTPEIVASQIIQRLDLRTARTDLGLDVEHRARVQLVVPQRKGLGIRRRIRRFWVLRIQIPASRLAKRPCPDLQTIE